MFRKGTQIKKICNGVTTPARVKGNNDIKVSEILYTEKI
jgi:hypothetical protein